MKSKIEMIRELTFDFKKSMPDSTRAEQVRVHQMLIMMDSADVATLYQGMLDAQKSENLGAILGAGLKGDE